MGLIAWIIIGALVGFIAGKFVDGKGRGIIVNTVVGLVGAVLGGFIVNGLGGTGINGINVWSMLVALGGAILLLFALNGFKRTKNGKGA